jgi:nucleoside-diphosphate-sugar epimerase
MPYARAKSAAELWLRPRMATDNMNTIILRPGIVWGPRSPHTLQIVKMLLDKAAYLVGDGRGIFNAIYIDNLVSGIRACCNSRPGTTGFFNVADAETITWVEFFSAFAKHVGYDMARIPSVSGDRCPVDSGLALDWLLSLPGVNGLYHRSKRHVPDRLKSRLKTWLAAPYDYGGAASQYMSTPHVDRELWHLQKVQHKLAHTKFARHFGVTNHVSFDEGVRRTLNWLAFMGCVRPAGVPSRL